MALSMATDCPQDVLARGTHLGFEWVVMRGPSGVFRCGYVRVPPRHPWDGLDRKAIEADVHGGITWVEFDFEDGGYWLGFDCAHATDLPDLTLVPGDDPLSTSRREMYAMLYNDRRLAEFEAILPMTMWTRPMVEAECLSLCEQAAAKGR